MASQPRRTASASSYVTGRLSRMVDPGPGKAPGVLNVLRRHPLPPLLVAFGLATGGIFLMGWVAGWGGFVAALGHFQPQWLAVAAGGQLVAYGGYTLAYRAVVRTGSAEHVSMRLCLRLVVAGFGGFEPSGGFGVD